MRDMTKGAPLGHLFLYAVPLLLGNWLQLAYNAVDSIIAGRFIGQDALAAEGVAGPVMNLVILAISGLCIGAGVLLFGGRLVHMVGSNITRLNPSRALCVSLATAITVLGFSSFGLPVSTTHIAVGGVFGIGFYREWRDRRLGTDEEILRDEAPLPDEERRRRHLVRRSHVRTILSAWLITVPAAAMLAAALAWLGRL